MTAFSLDIQESFQKLVLGNKRFVLGEEEYTTRHKQPSQKQQKPFAVVLGCSDSRAPVEIIFNQGLGDLFIIRIAGNIVSPSQLASVIFAVEQLGVKLIVVLGHSQCGAVTATIEHYNEYDKVSHLHPILNYIFPVIESLIASSLPHETLVKKAIRANICNSTQILRQEPNFLKPRIEKGLLCVIGGEYFLDNGSVDFFDGVPDSFQIR